MYQGMSLIAMGHLNRAGGFYHRKVTGLIDHVILQSIEAAKSVTLSEPSRSALSFQHSPLVFASQTIVSATGATMENLLRTRI
jgi:hypothetical protein